MKNALYKVLLSTLNISIINIYFLLLTKKALKNPEEGEALVSVNISLLKSLC